MTKQEIREKHLYKNGLSVNKSPVGNQIQKAAYDAMDEYAEQQSDYWKKRCEAAEVILHLAGDFKGIPADERFIEPVYQWQELKNNKP